MPVIPSFKHLCITLALAPLPLMLGCAEREPEAPVTDQEELLALGSSRSRLCISCHGRQGISQIPANPSLAGLSREYLSEQLYAYRDGGRDNPIMTSIAANLSDNDIAALSLYYSTLPGPPKDQE